MGHRRQSRRAGEEQTYPDVVLGADRWAIPDRHLGMRPLRPANDAQSKTSSARFFADACGLLSKLPRGKPSRTRQIAPSFNGGCSIIRPTQDVCTCDVKPADGERAALVGFGGQFGIAARIVLSRLNTIQWIRVADPSAGIADDFQFRSESVRHALQVKWSEHPSAFTWSDLVGSSSNNPPLIAGLARAWSSLRKVQRGALQIHLCSNNYASTTNSPSSTLARCQREGPKHFAAFLAQSFAETRRWLSLNSTSWDGLTELDSVVGWLPAWEELRDATGLPGDDFVTFVRDFNIELQMSDGRVGSELIAQDERDHHHLAATLQSIVRDRARPVELDRAELLDRLGWATRLTYRSRHIFPVPSVYAANAAVKSALDERLENLSGGYLALVGPAGSGKSTLLSKLDPADASIVRYYAFVPDSADPLSIRGEATSFAQDLTMGLEETGLRRVGIGPDLTCV